MTLDTTAANDRMWVHTAARWVLALALPALVLLSADFGVTWDEPQQRQKAHHLLAYWEGRAQTLEVPDDGAHLYGAPLDVVAAATEKALSLDPYVVRHALIAVIAWVGLWCTYRLAVVLFGPAEGACAALLLSISPFFMAHAANNPKDLPFAVFGVAWLLALARLPVDAPLSRPSHVLALAVLLGLGLNVRAGALLFWGYLAVLAVVRALQSGMPPRVAAVAIMPGLLAVLAGGIAIGWVTWPWAYAQPLTAPFRGLIMLSRFPWGGRILFDGVSYAGFDVPGSYVLRWFWMVLSPVMLAGAAVSWRLMATQRQGAVIALWAVVAFPVIYVTGTKATMYDGVRHLLFLVPPLAVLAGAGLMHAYRHSRGWTRWVVASCILVGLAEPLVFQLRNHPHQAAYVQPLAGGPRAAFGRFDLDYWGNCLLEGMRRAATSAAAPVFISGWPRIILEANAGRVPGIIVVDETDPRVALTVRLVRGGRAEVEGLASAPDVVGRVATADGAVLCVVQSQGRSRQP